MVRYDTPLHAAILCIAVLLSMSLAQAHDAPAQVTVRMHLRVVGSTMRALVRVPLEAVRDVDFPGIEGGYLDVAKTVPLLPGLAKIWVADPLELYENGKLTGPPRVVSTQLSILADRSFGSYENAERRLRSPLPESAEKLYWKQVFFDVALEYPVADPRSAFAIRPAYANLGERVDTVLNYGERTLLLPGDQQAFPLDPSWWQAATLFIRLGFVHILEGVDHLLFLLCLVIPVRRFGSLIWVATAFTVAHSLTLIASALGLTLDALWFPPFVEFLIAVSIVYMALANVVGGAAHASWGVAFGFGLVHGFGFSFALREQLQFAGGHLATALLAFNVGVELGQLAALAVMAPALAVVFRYVMAERMGMIVISALVAHTGWHWMWERAEILRKYSFAGPALNAGFWATTLRWLMVLLLIWGLVAAGRKWWGKPQR